MLEIYFQEVSWIRKAERENIQKNINLNFNYRITALLKVCVK